MPRTLVATLDYWDDPADVYSIQLAKGEGLLPASASGARSRTLALWKPGTQTMNDSPAQVRARGP